MVDRISSSAFHTRTVNEFQSVQASLEDLNRQISSGRIAENFADLNGKVERVSSFQQKLSKTDTYIDNNTLVLSRLRIMDSAVEQVQDLITEFSQLLTARNSILGEDLNFTAQANSLLDRVEGQLNTTSEGRYLFAGSRTSTPPADPLANLVNLGVADSNYYRGNSEPVTARVSDSLELSYGVLASEPAFQNVLASIKTAIDADVNGTLGGFEQAVDLINTARDLTAGVRAQINSHVITVEDVNILHERSKVSLNQALSADTDTDLAEATIALTANETILQASFQAFATLSGLRLSDYL